MEEPFVGEVTEGAILLFELEFVVEKRKNEIGDEGS